MTERLQNLGFPVNVEARESTELNTVQKFLSALGLPSEAIDLSLIALWGQHEMSNVYSQQDLLRIGHNVIVQQTTVINKMRSQGVDLDLTAISLRSACEVIEMGKDRDGYEDIDNNYIDSTLNPAMAAVSGALSLISK